MASNRNQSRAFLPNVQPNVHSHRLHIPQNP